MWGVREREAVPEVLSLSIHGYWACADGGQADYEDTAKANLAQAMLSLRHPGEKSSGHKHVAVWSSRETSGLE